MDKIRFSMMVFFCVLSLSVMGCSGDRNSKGLTEKSISENMPANQADKGKAVVVLYNTDMVQKPLQNSNVVQGLKKGNLVKILEFTGDGWCYVEPICFNYPSQKGYIQIDSYTSDFTKEVPNQGFINSKNLYSKPDINSSVVFKEHIAPINILKRENGWVYCSLPAGAQNCWVKESEIEYKFPDN